MKNKVKNILEASFLLVTIFLCIFLYKDTFRAYFFQDDWFSFSISNAKDISDFFRFFIPRTDVIYYRPLGMQVPFFLMGRIFGINPFPFRILTLITHSLNIFLTYLLIKFLTKNKIVAFLSSFFYAVSLVNYIPFYWSATYAFVSGPTFFLISFLLFYQFLTNQNSKYYYFSFTFFLSGLFMNEIIVVLPLIILSYLFIFNKFKTIKSVIPFFILDILFISIRFLFFTPPSSGNYQMLIGRHILTNFKTYILFSFNWSETITEQMIHTFIFNPQFYQEFRYYAQVSLATFFILILFLFILPLSLLIYEKSRTYMRLLFLGVIWYAIGLLPVIFFPKHVYAYYLPVSLLGFLLLTVSLFYYFLKRVYKRNKVISYVILIIVMSSWYYTSGTSFAFNKFAHWAPRRAEISERLINEAKVYYPKSIDYPYIYIYPSAENKLSLNNQEGLKIIFNDNSVKTIYQSVEGKKIL